MISFNQIPIDLRVPGQYIEFDSSQAIQGLVAQPHKILLIGQRLTTGSVAAGVPTRVLSAAEGETYFGRGSMLATMIAALKSANRYTEAWAVALDDDAAGVAASGNITLGGAITSSGTLAFYVGGVQVRVAVTSGDAPSAVATALAAAINADTSLPVTAVVNGVVAQQVDITARHKGEAGNSIDLRVNYYTGEQLPSGMTTAITAMSGGTANPDITAAISAIGDTQYNTIIMPYTDAANLTALETELSSRWGPLKMIEGHAFAAASGTHAALVTLGDSRNSQFVTIMGTGSSPTLPEVWAAVVGGVDAFEPDPARPRQTLALPGLLPPAEESLFTLDERNLLLKDGISTFITDSGGNVQIERLITTYQQTAAGVPDTSYLDVTTMRTLAFLRFSVRTRIALKFPRHKLANDGTRFGPGQAIVTPNIIRAELIALFRDWEDAGLAENIDQFQADLLVERNTTDPNRVDAIIPPDIINQFRMFAGQVQFRL